MATRVSVRWRRCRVSVRACCNSYRWCWCGRCSHPPQSKTHMKMTAPSDERDKQPLAREPRRTISRFGEPSKESVPTPRAGRSPTRRIVSCTSREDKMTSTASRRHEGTLGHRGGRGVSMPYLQVPPIPPPPGHESRPPASRRASHQARLTLVSVPVRTQADGTITVSPSIAFSSTQNHHAGH